MADVTVKASDGVREVSVEVHGSDDETLSRAEETATRLYGLAAANAPGPSRTGFGGWALSSDHERSPEE